MTMPSQLSRLLIMVLCLMPAWALGQSLSNGGRVSDVIAKPGEQDTYSFTAGIGEGVQLQVGWTSGTLAPGFTVYGPTDAVVGSAYGSRVGALSFSAPITGSYRVVVSDLGHVYPTETGGYNLYFTRAPGANEHGALTNGGQANAGVIDLGDLDSYTFFASAGEGVQLQVGATSGTLAPGFAVYSPTGAMVGSAYGSRVGAFSFAAPITGTYTVVVSDLGHVNRTETGGYNLYFTQAPGANELGSLNDGLPHADRIDLGDLDSYIVRAKTGDVLQATVRRIGAGTLWPGFRVYGPAGELAFDSGCGVEGEGRGGSIPLTKAGTYTVVVYDLCHPAREGTGQYSITLTGATADQAVVPSKDGLNGLYGLGSDGVLCSPSGTPNPFVGNPINIALGYKKQVEIDFAGGVLSFRRIYRSDSTWTLNTIGQRWRHNFARSLSVSDTAAQIMDGTGAIAEFTRAGAAWVPADPDIVAKFETVASGYVYTTPDDAREVYDSNKRLVRIHYRGSQALSLTYSTTGNLTQVKDESGRAILLTYSGSTLTALTTRSGSYFYRYGTNGNLIAVTNPNNKTRTYHYEDGRFPGALTGITDERGIRYATYAYDAQGRAVLSKHAGDVDSYTVAYEADDRVTTTNPLGKQTTYQFKTIHGVRKIVAVQGHISTNCAAANKAYTYDANGWLASKTDWNGNTTEYGHDARGLMTTMREGVGTEAARTTTYTYHPTFRLPISVQEEGRTTAYGYDTFGRLTSMTVTDTVLNQSRATVYTYHANKTDTAGNVVLGKLATVNGPRTDVNDITAYQYLANGDLFRVTNALGHTKEILQRDAAGRPVRIADPNNVEDGFAYDPQGRLIRYTQGLNVAPNKGVTTYSYTGDGRLNTVTVDNGVSLSYVYDDAGRIAKFLNSDSSILYTRDAAGNPIEITHSKLAAGSPAAYRALQTYDELSRLLSTRNNTNKTSFSYDANSNVVGETDASNRTTVFDYDSLDRLKKITDRLRGYTTYALNPLNDITGVTNPKGNTTSYTRNAFGEIMSEVSPERGTLTYLRDEAGNVTRRTDGRGVVTTYSYDALNRLTRVSYPSESAIDVALTYDASNGCGSGKGRLCSVASTDATRSYVYNALGDVTTVTDARPGARFTTAYTYDNAHYLTGITLPSGRQIAYSYNRNGELTGVSAGGTVLAHSFAYLPFGPVSRMTYGNGLVRSDTYDAAYRLTGRVIGAVVSDGYAYDNNDNVSTRNGVLFGYDELDRLARQGADSYTYDANGNRTAQVVGGVSRSMSYPSDSGRVSQIGGVAVSYDGAGNIIADGERSYTYDAQGRLKDIRVGGTVVGSYAYDGAHQRIRKSAGDGVTHYVYGLDGRLYGEYSSAGGLAAEYVYAGSEVLAQVNAGDVFTYLHTDHLGTPRTGTNSLGGQVWAWSGDAYGVGVPSGSAIVNLRMAGQYFDAESSLFYNWYRYYDPKTGRFTTSDPIGMTGGTNTYSYAAGNPVMNVDPSGLCLEDFCVAETIIVSRACWLNLVCRSTVLQLAKQLGKRITDAVSVVMGQDEPSWCQAPWSASDSRDVVDGPAGPTANEMGKGGKQKVSHDHVRVLANSSDGDYCENLKKIMDRARRMGDSKLFNDAKATYKEDCRGY